jgi:cellulose biosynthesis protein BcsQ
MDITLKGDKMETKSYVIWNNKGGVGKSTISFHIAYGRRTNGGTKFTVSF